MRPLESLKDPGYTAKIDFNDLQYYLRCPFRWHMFTKEKRIEKSYALRETLEACASTYALKSLIMDPVPKVDIVRKFKSSYPLMLGFHKYDDVGGKSELDKLDNLYDSLVALQKRFIISMPTLEMHYTSHGVTVNIKVHMVIKTKNKKQPETSYLIVDTERPTEPYNSTARFLSNVVKALLMDEGLATINVLCLNIHTKKLIQPKLRKLDAALSMLDKMCLQFASRNDYPRFGGQCHTCPYITDCVEELT